jgi:hypothetical protein
LAAASLQLTWHQLVALWQLVLMQVLRAGLVDSNSLAACQAAAVAWPTLPVAMTG